MKTKVVSASRLLSSEKLIAIKEELDKIKWDIIGFTEPKPTGEQQIILKSIIRAITIYLICCIQETPQV